MELKDYLKKLREKNNLSQGDLAKAIGVSRQSISKWELGLNQPKLDKLIALSKLYNVDMAKFFKHFK